MNVHDTPVMVDATLEEALEKVIDSCTHITDEVDALLSSFFDPVRSQPWNSGRFFDANIRLLYNYHAEGVVAFHTIFNKLNISQKSLQEYLHKVAYNLDLESVYHTEDKTYNLSKTLMSYANIKEGVDLMGYPVNSVTYDKFNLSTSVDETVKLWAYKMVKYIVEATRILTQPEEDKTPAQAKVIEAFLVWVKIGLVFRIDIELAIKVYNYESSSL